MPVVAPFASPTGPDLVSIPAKWTCYESRASILTSAFRAATNPALTKSGGQFRIVDALRLDQLANERTKRIPMPRMRNASSGAKARAGRERQSRSLGDLAQRIGVALSGRSRAGTTRHRDQPLRLAPRRGSRDAARRRLRPAYAQPDRSRTVGSACLRNACIAVAPPAL